MSTKAKGVYAIHSDWSEGSLIFYEKAYGMTTTGNILKVGATAVQVGDTAQVVDFAWYANGGLSFVLSASDSSMTLIGCNVSVDGDVVITTDDIALDQGYFIYFDGLTGGESIRSDTENYLAIKGTTGVDIQIGSTDEVNITATAVTLPTNNLILTAGHASVAQGSYVYLDGQGGGEYLRSGTANYLLVNATTAVDLGIGGVTKVRVQTAEVEFQSGVYVDILGDLGVTNSLTVVGNVTLSGTDVGIAGTLTVITAINNGYDAAGGAVNMYANTTGGGAFFSPTADTNKGSFSVGAAGGSKGTDFFAYGTTNGNYLQWDQSADDLLLVGTATQLAVAGTAVSSSITTGSLRTAGGLGVEGAAYVGGLVSSAGGFVSTAQTLTPDATRSYIAYQIGTRAAAKDITMVADAAQNLDPIQLNLNIIGANPSVTSTVNGIYQLITHNTAAMANLRLKGADFTTIVGQNVKDAYAYQGEIQFTTGAVVVSGEACVMGLVLNAGTDGVTGGVRGLKISMGGSGMPAGTSAGLSIDSATAAGLGHAIYIETQSGTTITNGLYMGNAGTFTNAIYVGGTIANFLDLSTAGNAGFVTTGAKGGTVNYTLKVIAPDGAARYINLYSAA